jgi:hypothetical protein
MQELEPTVGLQGQGHKKDIVSIIFHFFIARQKQLPGSSSG